MLLFEYDNILDIFLIFGPGHDFSNSVCIWVLCSILVTPTQLSKEDEPIRATTDTCVCIRRVSPPHELRSS
jgi:hypothetical protein